jgi:CubicO group peptidase (beta-lactamase class C family)
MRIRTATLLVPVLVLGACVPKRPPTGPAPMRATATLVSAPPGTVGMRADVGARLDSVMKAALAEGAAPGAALAVGRYGRLVHERGYGRVDVPPTAAPVNDSTLFDLASLTKVVATTTAAMLLEEAGVLDLDRPVSAYLPEFGLLPPPPPGAPTDTLAPALRYDTAKARITVRMLVTHRGGLDDVALPRRTGLTPAEYIAALNRRPLGAAPGVRMKYTDADMLLMGFIIERLSGEPLDRFLTRRVFTPLAMRETMFNPPSSLLPRIAATEALPERGGTIRGQVHDPSAFAFGGVAGNAGLFSSARDLAVFSQMLLNGGEYGGVRLLRPETVARWTAPQDLGSSRALGWDTPSDRSSAGPYFGPRAFGHTGYTGTSIWIDPERGLFVVLLTNRVNPSSSNQRHVALRRSVGEVAQTSILDAPLVDWEARR